VVMLEVEIGFVLCLLIQTSKNARSVRPKGAYPLVEGLMHKTLSSSAFSLLLTAKNADRMVPFLATSLT